jgi:predicted Zn-dependent peptidase
MRKSKLLFTIVTLAIASSFLYQKASAGVPKLDSFTLSNGIRVVSLYIQDSNNVSIFTYLPMSLASDGPSQTQWSHLVEHLVIRTTVPFGSQQANAETLPDHTRLDFYGTINNWQEGLSHHAKWLKGIPFTEKILQAEKLNINSECENVARRLFTHKFAMAAWTQGYRHGLKHAALKADINKASLDEIQEYRDKYLAVLNRAVVCVVGGVDAKTLKPVVTEKLGNIQTNASLPKAVKLHPGEHKMTWDLDAKHLVLTWPIPNFTENDYAALVVAGQWLNMKFFSDAELKPLTGMVLAGADLTVPEGNFFYISASLKPESSFDDVKGKIIRHLQTLRSQPAALIEAAMLGQQLSYQMTNLMDPAVFKAQAPPNVTMAMIEGNLAIQWAMHDFRYGLHRATLAKQLTVVAAQQVSQAAAKYLSDYKCYICTLSFSQ